MNIAQWTQDPESGRATESTPDRAIRTAVFLLLLAVGFLAGCGYQVAGRAAHVPKEWKSIAVPAFTNDTTQYRIEQRLTEAVIRELISHTKYRIVQNTESADAVLRGEVLSIETNPVLFDAKTGEVTAMLVTVHAKVRLIDNSTQKPVYQNDDMIFRDQYQISGDVQSFFEEEGPALDRMSRDFASDVVANVLEGF
jgi:outer membrane lipopolysaccharide assembly protein LptE/RlpB